MRGVLAEDIELALEVLGIKRTTPAGITLTIVRTQDYKRLEDGRLLACSRGAQNGAIGGNLSPAEDAEAEVARELGKHRLLLLQADGVVRLEEKVTGRVLARGGQLAANFALSLALEELVWDARHDTGTVTVARVRAGRTTVGHRAA